MVKNTTMTKKTEDSSLNSNLMQRCESFMKNNIDKFHNYAKHQETFRLQLIATNDEYKNLQTWLDTACVNIISLKSEQGESLLQNNCVTEFLHIMNDLHTQRLKFIETINECKILKRTVDLVNEDIVSLKSEYNTLKQNCNEVLKKDLASKILDKFSDTINCCERVNCSLDTALERIKMLNTKYDNLMERYRVLSENKIVKEFLEYAKHQAKASRQYRANEETTSLKLQLTETLKLLHSERLRRDVAENERNSLDKLSDKLCRVMFKYQHRESPDGINEESAAIKEPSKKSANKNNASSNHSDTVVDSTSSSKTSSSKLKTKSNVTSHRKNLGDEYQVSCFNEDIYEPAVIKLENPDTDDSKPTNSGNILLGEHKFPYLNENDEELAVIKEETANALPITFAASLESPKSSNTNSENNNVSKNKCDKTTLSKQANKKKTVPKCRKSCKRKRKPCIQITISKSPKKLRPIPSSHFVENESFHCDRCRKSFVVKPNERKPQNCPFCDIVQPYIFQRFK